MKPKQQRFQNNTSIAPVDRRRVLGFAPGVPYMTFAANGSNQQSEWIEQGRLLVFNPRVDKGYDGDWKKVPVETSGATFRAAVKRQFQDQVDWGYRNLEMLDGLPYNEKTGEDDADLYFNTVHPTLAEVGIFCEMGLDTGMAETGDPCSFCRAKWLESAEVRERMRIAVTADALSITNPPLDYNLLEKLRVRLLEAYQTANAFNEAKLEESKGDIENKRNGGTGLSSLTDADRYRMKLLHRKAEHIEQAEIVTRQAREQGKAIAEGLRQTIGQTATVDVTADMSAQEKAEFWAWKAEKERQKADGGAGQIESTPADIFKAHIASGRCAETTNNGSLCEHTAKYDGFCGTHKRSVKDD